MFFLCQRTDTIPEQRALVNAEQVVAILPVAGGIKSKLYLTNGEAWEIGLAFARAVALFREETDVVAGMPTPERPRPTAPSGTAAEPPTVGFPSIRRS
ncbi:MAG TPA: hypothetical protein VHW90_02390 [Stellaceae bacterium]|jgi:hypothetical protein|nr:hypothetical protein [Stellaceae bacterium]